MAQIYFGYVLFEMTYVSGHNFNIFLTIFERAKTQISFLTQLITKMKNAAFIFTIQIFENSQSQMVFDYIEYLILLICFMAASILMMLIPIILCYSMVDNFIRMNGYKKDIRERTKSEEASSKYLKAICIEYNKASSKFF